MAAKTDKLTVEIKVNRALREYLTGINGGSDLLRLDFKSEAWVAIKSRLQTVPNNYAPQPSQQNPDTIKVELPSTHAGAKLYNIDKGEAIHHDYLFRSYLDEASQRQIEAFLMKSFKKTFRDFMTGAVTTNTETSIKDAIYTFCDVHHIEMNYVTYEMLRKDWYRYKNRTSRGEPSPEIKEEFS